MTRRRNPYVPVDSASERIAAAALDDKRNKMAIGLNTLFVTAWGITNYAMWADSVEMSEKDGMQRAHITSGAAFVYIIFKEIYDLKYAKMEELADFGYNCIKFIEKKGVRKLFETLDKQLTDEEINAIETLIGSEQRPQVIESVCKIIDNRSGIRKMVVDAAPYIEAIAVTASLAFGVTSTFIAANAAKSTLIAACVSAGVAGIVGGLAKGEYLDVKKHLAGLNFKLEQGLIQDEGPRTQETRIDLYSGTISPTDSRRLSSSDRVSEISRDRDS